MVDDEIRVGRPLKNHTGDEGGVRLLVGGPRRDLRCERAVAGKVPASQVRVREEPGVQDAHRYVLARRFRPLRQGAAERELDSWLAASDVRPTAATDVWRGNTRAATDVGRGNALAATDVRRADDRPDDTVLADGQRLAGLFPEDLAEI